MKQDVKGEEAMELFKVVKANNLLPSKIDKLVPLSFIGQAAVGYYRNMISHMEEMGMTIEQQKATLRDGQDAGELLLDIEARIGEIADKEERRPPLPDPTGTKGNRYTPSGSPPKHERLGMSEKKMNQAQTIHKNPAAVARIKAEARANEDIPTKTAVLKQIHLEALQKKFSNPIPAKPTKPAELDAVVHNIIEAMVNLETVAMKIYKMSQCEHPLNYVTDKTEAKFMSTWERVKGKIDSHYARMDAPEQKQIGDKK